MSYKQFPTKSEDNIYLNVVFNHDPSYQESGSPARYQVTKSSAILDKASDYYCSVIRFDIPLDEIPLYIFPIIPNQANPNLSPMIIGIRILGVNFPVNLIYVPNNNNPAPNQVGSLTQVITPYYYVYSYQNLIDSFNTALSTAYVNAGNPGGAGAPFIVYDSVTQLISIVVPVAFITAGATIFWNRQTNNYLNAFHTFFLGLNDPQGREFDLLALNDGINGFDVPGQTIAVATPPTFLKIIQQYNTINYWTSLRKIVITTGTIPIRSEFIPVTTQNRNLGSDINSSLGIITDFVPALELAGQSRSISYYYPEAQYRLVDLVSDQELKKIDLSLYWEDKNGNLYPITISPFQQASVKIGFFKKTLYSS